MVFTESLGPLVVQVTIVDMLLGNRNVRIRIDAAGFKPAIGIGPKRKPATIWMEVIFDRKKGQYYSHTEFGIAIVPNSDEMVRCSTTAMMRKKTRLCELRACFDRLDA